MPTQGDTVKVPSRDMAVRCPCFLVLNSNGWADFLSNPVLPFVVVTVDNLHLTLITKLTDCDNMISDILKGDVGI